MVLIAMTGICMPGFGTEPVDHAWDCAAGQGSAPKATAHLKAPEVSALASAAAKRRGYDPVKIQQTGICFDASKEPRSWTVYFEVSDARPVKNFRIWVRDDTGAAKLMSGK